MERLHGVEPKGKPHFDFQWFFNKEVGLRPCEGGESGCNLLVWNRWYINQFYRQFPFRELGAEEEKVLEEYFKSDHFSIEDISSACYFPELRQTLKDNAIKNPC